MICPHCERLIDMSGSHGNPNHHPKCLQGWDWSVHCDCDFHRKIEALESDLTRLKRIEEKAKALLKAEDAYQAKDWDDVAEDIARNEAREELRAALGDAK